eukprot:TRINITY_DN80945_c0_g1_i1.p1 TRINITY_DN80945_c0_g1~~TRINITY_DN80945_c0_g1_i1.p1  ORF type:complete len:180 (-),score=30.08 TRINITY_DN80945_c0_g1_i1:80-562(-)
MMRRQRRRRSRHATITQASRKRREPKGRATQAADLQAACMKVLLRAPGPMHYAELVQEALQILAEGPDAGEDLRLRLLAALPLSWLSKSEPLVRLPGSPDGNGMTSSHRKEECRICMVAAADAAFMPCGHRAACEACARRCSPRGCPFCRAPVKDVIKMW